MYPVSYKVDYQEHHNRLTTFFRLFLAIPLIIWAFIYGIAANFAVVVAWFVLVFTEKYPPALYEFVTNYIRFLARVSGYIFMLTDRYPSFSGDEDDTYPVRVAFAGPLPKYNRWKALFRIILMLPIFVFLDALNGIMEAVAIATWVVILFTGRTREGLYAVQSATTSYSIRARAYMSLVTETYPPVKEDLQAATWIPAQLQAPAVQGGTIEPPSV